MDAALHERFVFLRSVQPFDRLPGPELEALATTLESSHHAAGTTIFTAGEPITHLHLLERGVVEIREAHGGLVSELGHGDWFGERGLLRDGLARTTARATADARVWRLPGEQLHRLIDSYPAIAGHFRPLRARVPGSAVAALASVRADVLMASPVVGCAPEASVAQAAGLMRQHHVSCIAVLEDGALRGIVTARDLAERVLAEGRAVDTPVAAVMTRDPETLPPDAPGSDVLRRMLQRGIGHLPVVADGEVLGIVTQTDLTRYQARSSAHLATAVGEAGSSREMARVTARIPQLLVQLVEANTPHEVATRQLTDVTDAVTRRLIVLAEARLGPAPVPYVWLACGSQGRQEQTGVSDQDNCLLVDDAAREADLAWFHELAKVVCHGMHEAGYVYCPGGMMAMNERWRQPLRTWKRYFRGWVDTPSPESQMLASVMFDLRPISGSLDLFQQLQPWSLELAASNSIFAAHMISNSLQHTPPLGMLRGLATIRSGEHRNRIDMKLNGVIPVTDLARLYALRGRLAAANTRARLVAAADAGVISASGSRDLVDAYDLIASLRLAHQARLVRAGRRPDNYLDPSDLSDFERGHLRDAFVVVRTMQSAIGHGRGAPS